MARLSYHGSITSPISTNCPPAPFAKVIHGHNQFTRANGYHFDEDPEAAIMNGDMKGDKVAGKQGGSDKIERVECRTSGPVSKSSCPFFFVDITPKKSALEITGVAVPYEQSSLVSLPQIVRQPSGRELD